MYSQLSLKVRLCMLFAASLSDITKLCMHGSDCLDPGEGKSNVCRREKKANQWALQKIRSQSRSEEWMECQLAEGGIGKPCGTRTHFPFGS